MNFIEINRLDEYKNIIPGQTMMINLEQIISFHPWNGYDINHPLTWIHMSGMQRSEIFSISYENLKQIISKMAPLPIL
jgi:hypothetical protein